MSENCVLCKIAKGEIETEFVYRDDVICAVNDINPVAPVHILIFPLEHITGIDSLGIADNTLLGHIISGSKTIAEIVGIDGTGFRTVINQGSDSGQEIEHLHAHVIGGQLLGVIA